MRDFDVSWPRLLNFCKSETEGEYFVLILYGILRFLDLVVYKTSVRVKEKDRNSCSALR